MSKKRSARDFRNTNIQVPVGEDLQPEVWYRSPLWNSDHVVGLDVDFVATETAWCGRGLGVARDWENEEFGGLWYSQRTSASAKCAECRRRQAEWVDRRR